MVDLTLTVFSGLFNLYLLFVVLFFRVIFNNRGLLTENGGLLLMLIEGRLRSTAYRLDYAYVVKH